MNDAQLHKKSLLKVVVLGDAGVGKTSLVKQYCNGTFDPQYKPTIGADFLTTDITLPKLGQLKLQIWDTAGQERFRSMATSFYRGADACVLVYDMCETKSFQNLDMWKKEFLENICSESSTGDFPFVVLGNKADKTEEVVVAKSRAEAWCKSQSNISLFETSAFSKQNLDEAFQAIAARCYSQIVPSFALVNVEEVEQRSTVPEMEQKCTTPEVIDENVLEDEPAYSEDLKSRSDRDVADMLDEEPRRPERREKSPDESSKRGRKKSKPKKKAKSSRHKSSRSNLMHENRYQKKKVGRSSRRGSYASVKDSPEDNRSRASYESAPRDDTQYRRTSPAYRHGRNQNIRLEDDDSYSTGSEAAMMCCDF